MREETQLEKLKWSISLLRENKSSETTQYFNEVENHKPINELSGKDIVELLDGGWTLSIQDYLQLTARISNPYMNEVKNFIKSTFYGLHYIKHETFMEYIVDFYRSGETYTDYLRENFIKPMDFNDVEKICLYYYTYKGIKAGFLDGYKPTTSEFNNITINREEIIETYILINGGYEPNQTNPTIEDFKKGRYSSHTYQSVSYIGRHILENEPELIGRKSITINRESLIDGLLENQLLENQLLDII